MTSVPRELDLDALQHRLMDSIYGAEPEKALIESIRPRRGISTKSLLSLYRNATRATLLNALRLSYPVVQRLVGKTFFDALASDYCDDHPSRSGDLEHYGADFCTFLDHHRSLGELRYLGDVARLEWLLAKLQGAMPVKALDRAQLASVSSDGLADLELSLIPRAALFDSPYPTVRIWEANADPTQVPGPISLDEGACRVLLVVSERPHFFTLTLGEHAFYACLTQTTSLLQAVEAAVAADPRFDVASSLDRALNAQALRADKPRPQACINIENIE
ncbi:MAG: DUF2063 domain-containing protein [Nevskiaceae bacterium]|nr:MAG: DUF2063 domain-containing protein [Nevskiaceae bacterium]